MSEDVRPRLSCRTVVDLLSDHLDRALSTDLAQDVAEHLRRCPACTRYLEQLAATVAALKRLRGGAG